jgi:hypothetical protein
MLLNNIILISLQIFILILLFQTNFIYEYSKLFKLIKKINLLKEYEDYIYKNNFLKLIDFLSLKPNFFFKLLSCPLCLNFWLSLASAILINNILYIGLNYIITILIYLIISLLYGKYIRTHI